MGLPNLEFYTQAQLTTLRNAVIAERLRRVTGEAITQGNKNGRGYSVQLISDQELSNLESEIARRLRVFGDRKRRITFNPSV